MLSNSAGASFVILLVGANALANSYENQTACEKEDYIWNKIRQTEYQTLPKWTGSEPLKLFRFLLPFARKSGEKHMNVTMERQSDMLPAGRKKAIHTYGSVAPIAFVSDGNIFSGVFQGATCGFIRLSLAAKPDKESTMPGLAVKLFLDKKPSLNFTAMFSLDGQEGYNFFKNDFSNWVAEPQNFFIKQLAKVFAFVTSDPTKVDVTYMGKYNADGTRVDDAEVNSPAQVYLVPNKSLNFPDTPHEVRKDFHSIPVGTTLYTVYGRKKEKAKSHRIKIGKIVIKDNFISSQFGDEVLFFRHENIDNAN